jgi:pimeloyl-ACP methyl ester carboxylesterase
MCPLVAIESAGAGEPLVLLHGIATDSRIWSGVVPALAHDRRVVTVDLPGFGRSAPAGDGFELERVASRICRGLAARGVRAPFDLVGHSLGGGVAIMLAARRPRLVRRLVLVAPAGLRPFPPAISTLLAATANRFLSMRRSAAPLADLVWGRRLLLALTAADGADVPPAVARAMIEASATARRTAPALETITSADLRPLLAEIQAPLGVVWGEADLTVPIRALAELLAVRPDARVVRLARAGHVPMVERPDAFVAALEQLLAQLPTTRALLKDDTNPSGAPSIVM